VRSGFILRKSLKKQGRVLLQVSAKQERSRVAEGKNGVTGETPRLWQQSKTSKNNGLAQ
jgi:hypothetical protein